VTPSRRGRAVAVSRIGGLRTLNRPEILSVDTLAAGDVGMQRWRPLCPFNVLETAELPVPGRPELRSRSMEAVWQGLKVVEGRLDLDQLTSVPHKRPPDDQRREDYRYADSEFMLGEKTLDLVTARYLIYLPTYLFVLSYAVSTDLLASIEDWLATGRDVAFYDWDANMDIDDGRSSFSHSALLARWFEGRLDPLVQHAGRLARAHGVAVPHLPTARPSAGATC
jgi:hypothetical protein